MQTKINYWKIMPEEIWRSSLAPAAATHSKFAHLWSSQSRIFILVQMFSLKTWRRKYKNNKLIFVLLNKYFVLYALAESYNFTEVITNNKLCFFFCAVMLPNREMRLNVFAPKEQYARAYKRHCENIIIYLLNCVRAQEFGAYTVNVMYALFCELKTKKNQLIYCCHELKFKY